MTQFCISTCTQLNQNYMTWICRPYPSTDSTHDRYSAHASSQRCKITYSKCVYVSTHFFRFSSIISAHFEFKYMYGHVYVHFIAFCLLLCIGAYLI